MRKYFTFFASRNKTFDGRKIRLLENLLITWKNQIQTAIHHDSSQTKSDLLPNIEIEFWIRRTENLQGIKTQVCQRFISIAKK